MEQLRIFAATLLLFGAVIAPAAADPVPVVAAENFYGDVAHQIGGDNVAVASILSSPDQDPHLFEASPSIAKQLAGAKIVIFNGADYDPWVEKLLAAHKVPGRKEILVSALVHKKAGDNPHLWYEPATMKVFAKRLAADLSAIDAARKGDYEKGASTFIESLKGLDARIAAMRKKYAGLPVTASEPVFGYMAQALGLAMRNEKFQLAVQNNTEPSVSEVAAFENDLKGHKVKIMLFNAQASEPAAQRLVKMAEEEKIPVVGVTETEPAGQTYQEWMLGQLDALDKALAGSTP
jgi:zinc/manganese transport system substrate-binding protein